MSLRDAALLMGAGVLLELPSVFKKTKRKTEQSFVQSNSESRRDHLRQAINRALSYGSIYAIHASSSWLVKLAIRSGFRPLERYKWAFAALCSAIAQLFLPEPLPGIVCALLVPRALGRLFIERFPSLDRLPLIVAWVPVATAMNIQLWTLFHLMPPRWREIMMNTSGMAAKEHAVVYRSQTRIVKRCCEPTHGIHPGEECVRSALTAMKRGLPSVFSFYAAIYLLKAIMELRSPTTRLAWRNNPSSQFISLLVRLIRSTICLWLSCAAGRTAFCFQSRLWPHDFKWWLGGVVGFFASFISLIDSAASRTELIEFNAGYVLHTEAVHIGSQSQNQKQMSRITSAILLALASAAYVAAEKGRGLLLLPMLAKLWR